MKRSRPDLTQRNAEIAKRVIAGEDCEAVGADYGIKSERVRQVTCRIAMIALATHERRMDAELRAKCRYIEKLRANSEFWIDLIDKTVVKP